MFTIHFANNLTIIGEDEIDVKYMLIKLAKECGSFAVQQKKRGLEMNTSKTECVILGGKGEDLEQGTKAIKNIRNCKYLGVTMTTDGDSNQEIKVRIRQAKTATTQLNSLLWSCLLYTSRCV